MTDKVEEPTPSTNDLIVQGTKCFWLRDYKNAVKALSQVSEMLVKEHGDDTHDSLGNVYLFYGKSLLELAREAGDPLGDVVPKKIAMAKEDGSDEEGESEGDDGEDDGEDEEEEEAEESLVEGEEEKEKTKENKTAVNGDAEKSQDDKQTEKSENAANTSKVSMNGESASAEHAADNDKEEQEGEGDEENDDEEEEGDEDEDVEAEETDEASDLQVAWEVLELAKEIFHKRGENGKEDYADCLITLGEVSMESENFEASVEDIKAGLEIQKGIFKDGKDFRKLAHSNYMLGMALCANNKTEESMECYKNTLNLLRQRLDVLKKLEKPGASDEQEIAEVQSLIPEVEEKITDLQNSIDECAKQAAAQIDDEKPTISSPEKKATNISHLVKRKRLEDGGAECSSAKKAALDA